MKKLTERYGRFHARFPLDDVYLALPRPLRNDAYLYLLALSGQRRAEEADMNCPRSVADALAHAMGLDPKKMLEALAAVKKDGRPRIVELVGDVVRLLKHDKWQDTPEQIAELKQARSEAGRKGNEARWGDRTPIANAIASGMANGIANASQAIAETEREIEKESPKASRSYKARVKDAIETDDQLVELSSGLSQLLGTSAHAMSQTDLITCQAALNQYAYLTAKDLIQRAGEHQDYCRDHALPIARTVAGFSDTWWRENSHRADTGQAKVDRRSVGRTSGMASVKDLLSQLRPPTDSANSPAPTQEAAS